MSAIPRLADLTRTSPEVREGPIGDIREDLSPLSARATQSELFDRDHGARFLIFARGRRSNEHRGRMFRANVRPPATSSSGDLAAVR